MSSSGQQKGSCGHIMAIFDSHFECVCCCDKGVGTDPCLFGEESCPHCMALTHEQKIQVSVPSYK